MVVLCAVVALAAGMSAAAPARSTEATLPAVETWLADRGGRLLIQHDMPGTDLYVVQLPEGIGTEVVREALERLRAAHACRSPRDALIGILDDYESAMHYGRTMLGVITDVRADHIDIRPHWRGSWSTDEWSSERPRGPRGWVRDPGSPFERKQLLPPWPALSQASRTRSATGLPGAHEERDTGCVE